MKMPHACLRLLSAALLLGGLPAPAQVTADTDSTGPNVWLGVGRRF